MREIVRSTPKKPSNRYKKDSRFHRLMNCIGTDSGGCSVSAPAFRPARTFAVRAASQPSPSSSRCSRKSVNRTATNSTVANFFPEQARVPSENGSHVPLGGLRIPCAPVVPVLTACDDDLCVKPGRAKAES